MDLETFKNSSEETEPPEGLSVDLEAMWYQGKGNWDQAHSLAQSENGASASWVHAHLHRVEGDIRNASYWYRLANKPICTLSIRKEWDQIVSVLLDSVFRTYER